MANFHRTTFKMGENIKEKYQRVQQMLNLFTRGHTNLELCKCRFKFSWISVACKNTPSVELT